VLLRDTKWRASSPGERQPVVTIPAEEWVGWLDQLRAGKDVGGCPAVDVIRNEWDRSVRLRSTVDAVSLWFTAPEWQAFLRGVREGEFDRPGHRQAAQPVG
jgi:hypothetical protein